MTQLGSSSEDNCRGCSATGRAEAGSFGSVRASAGATVADARGRIAWLAMAGVAHTDGDFTYRIAMKPPGSERR